VEVIVDRGGFSGTHRLIEERRAFFAPTAPSLQIRAHSDQRRIIGSDMNDTPVGLFEASTGE
jgi:hypothetical protein